MERFNRRAGIANLIASPAMAIALLAGCAGHSAVVSAGKVPAAREGSGSEDKSIARLEAQVARSPRNASARAELAQAYLAAGRFASAATTFEDAASLGDNDARLGLGQALAYIGSGRNAEALNVIDRWRAEIPASDLGLALALAGRPDQGVGVLTDAIRGGDASVKSRQNLAYAYALDGRWSEARVIASQDVPADQIDARLAEWATRARSDQYQVRVAGLLGAPVRVDAGQPVALALNGAEQITQVARAEVNTPSAAPAELPPVEAATAPQTPQLALAEAQNFEPKQAVPASEMPSPFVQAFVQPGLSRAQMSATVRSAHVKSPARGSFQSATHFVQLGAFSTLENAKRAQAIFAARHPLLKGHAMRITEAQVNGRHFFRVAAEGFGQGSAQSTCAVLRQRGGACFAYAGKGNIPGFAPGKAPMLAQR